MGFVKTDREVLDFRSINEKLNSKSDKGHNHDTQYANIEHGHDISASNVNYTKNGCNNIDEALDKVFIGLSNISNYRENLIISINNISNKLVETDTNSRDGE